MFFDVCTVFDEVMNQRKKNTCTKKDFKFYSIEIQVVALESGRTYSRRKKKKTKIKRKFGKSRCKTSYPFSPQRPLFARKHSILFGAIKV